MSGYVGTNHYGLRCLSFSDAAFQGKLGRHHERISLDRIIWLTSRGGWLGALDLDVGSALEIPGHYIDEIEKKI